MPQNLPGACENKQKRTWPVGYEEFHPRAIVVIALGVDSLGWYKLGGCGGPRRAGTRNDDFKRNFWSFEFRDRAERPGDSVAT